MQTQQEQVKDKDMLAVEVVVQLLTQPLVLTLDLAQEVQVVEVVVELVEDRQTIMEIMALQALRIRVVAVAAVDL
jgi:hypothetical protein